MVHPLDGGHGDHPGQVLYVVGGGGEDDPLLSGDVGLNERLLDDFVERKLNDRRGALEQS